MKVQLRRLYALDVVRFIACFWVLIWHYQHFFMVEPGVLPEGWSRESQPLYQLFSLFYENNYGVQVFWALSGMVFFYVYWEAVQKRRVGAWQFFVNRVSRLYPLICITTIVVFIIQQLNIRIFGCYFIYPNNSVLDLLRNLLCIPYIVPNDGPSLNNPFWSVSIELVFYALFFFMARFSHVPGLIGSAVALTVFLNSPIPRFVVGYDRLNSCGRYFFFGGVVWCVFSILAKRARFLVLGMRRFQSLGLLVQRMGDVSFGMYLWHVPVQLFLIALCRLGVIPFVPNSPCMLLIFLVCVIAVSILSFIYVEVPMRKWIRRLL